MRRILFLLAFLLPGVAALAQYKTLTDLPYRPAAAASAASANAAAAIAPDAYALERCKLDIYYPTEQADCPVVVWFHGGGLTGGNKFIPAELMNSGLVVVAVNYRLMPRADISDCIDDAAAAVAWTFHNIGRFNGAENKIFVAGHSAGGYLADMIGLDKHWLARYGIDADRIAALVPYSGQVITHFAIREKRGMSPTQPLIDEFAPLYHIRPDAPPIVIISADREQELYGRYEETAYFWRMLKLVGHKDVSMYELDGYDHGDMAVPAHAILKKHIKRLCSSR